MLRVSLSVFLPDDDAISHHTMGLRSLVSAGFLLLPIAVTLGLLLGLQAHREARGMPPPFVSNKVSTDTYCQRAFGISPATRGQQYTRECPFLPPPIPRIFGRVSCIIVPQSVPLSGLGR